MSQLLSFPWPPKELSPNARIHWAQKAKTFKAYRDVCIWTGMAHGKTLRGSKRFKLIFCAPDKRRRDADNMVSACKAIFDALAVLTAVDDSEFEWTYRRGNPVANGLVIVEVLG